jgi:hypothetical protein
VQACRGGSSKLTAAKELLQEFDRLNGDSSTPITQGFFDKVKEIFGEKTKK